jgi:AraC-like DNA-binding protein
MNFNQIKPSVLLMSQSADLFKLMQDGLIGEASINACRLEDAAMAHIHKAKPDMVIIDEQDTDIDVFSFCSGLKKNEYTAHICVGFIANSPLSLEYSLSKGADFSIQHPIKGFALNALIRNQLHTRQQLVRFHNNSSTVGSFNKSHELSYDEMFLKNVSEVIEKNIDDPELSVEYISQAMGISPNFLYRRVKRLTGKTVKDFIFHARISIGANLLVNGRYSITEVGYKVGFNSPSYFSRRFKEKYGCCPSEWVESYSWRNVSLNHSFAIHLVS